MIIIIKSNNPNFSHLMGKNPASPPKLKSIRKGIGCGWYFDNNTYCVRFQDADDEVSFPEYPNQEFEFLAKGKYCSAMLAHKLFSEFTQLDLSYDCVSENSLEIYSLHSKDQSIELFQKHMPSYRLEIEDSQYWSKFKKVVISKTCSFEEFYNFVCIFLFYISLDNERVFIHEELNTKQFEMLADLDAPYFVRYLFKQNYCKNSKKKFAKIEHLLNKTKRGKFQFSPFNNFEARFRFVLEHAKDADIVCDIGCGDGRYIKSLSTQNGRYIGVDIDKEVLEEAIEKSDKYGLANTSFYNSVNDLLSSLQDSVDSKIIVLSEVLEHISFNHIHSFINTLKKLKNVEKIIITLPNELFNKNYGLVDELRHDDHRWESNLELTKAIADMFSSSYEIFNLGDIVNGEPTTFGVVING